MFGIERKVEEAARKAAAFTAGGLLAAVGAGFLTVAAWLLLAELRTPLFAASVIGFVYMGLAAIAFAIGSKSRRPAPRAPVKAADPPGELSPLQLVVVSFLQGLEQGRQTKL